MRPVLLLASSLVLLVTLLGCGSGNPAPAAGNNPPGTPPPSTPPPGSPPPTQPPPSAAGIPGTFSEDIRLLADMQGGTPLGLITVNTAGGSAGDVHIIIDSRIVLNGAAPNATYDVRFCSIKSPTTDCFPVGSFKTDAGSPGADFGAGGNADVTLQFPRSGVFSGIFYFSRGGTDEMVSAFQTDGNSTYKARFQTLATLGFGTTNEFGAPGTDPLRDGGITKFGFSRSILNFYHVELRGAAANATYEVRFCQVGFSPGGCDLLGSVTTDANGDVTTDLQSPAGFPQFVQGVFVLHHAGATQYLSGFYVTGG